MSGCILKPTPPILPYSFLNNGLISSNISGEYLFSPANLAILQLVITSANCNKRMCLLSAVNTGRGIDSNLTYSVPLSKVSKQLDMSS